MPPLRSRCLEVRRLYEYDKKTASGIRPYFLAEFGGQRPNSMLQDTRALFLVRVVPHKLGSSVAVRGYSQHRESTFCHIIPTRKEGHTRGAFSSTSGDHIIMRHFIIVKYHSGVCSLFHLWQSTFVLLKRSLKAYYHYSPLTASRQTPNTRTSPITTPQATSYKFYL